MKYCCNCNVYLNSSKSECLLCDSEITASDKKENVQNYLDFPKRKSTDKIEFLIKIIMLYFCKCLVVLNFVSFAIFDNLFSIPACILIFGLHGLLENVFNKKNFSHNLFMVNLTVFSFTYLMDLFILSGEITLTYVLPIMTILMLVLLFFVVKNSNSYQDYFNNILIHILLSFVPFFLYFKTDGLTTVVPAAIAFVLGVISLVICLFRKDTIIELKKRLHM